MGTMIQQHRLDEAGYRGCPICRLALDLKGNNDLLVLTRPEIIRGIHAEYLAAGADIIETNSFNSTAISMADYKMEELARELSRESARLAREVADEFEARDPERPRYVAGVLGPTTRTASISRTSTIPGSGASRSSSWRPRTPIPSRGWSKAERTSCWSRRSSTLSTPRRRSSPSRDTSPPRACGFR
jgi:hypothetical protein